MPYGYYVVIRECQEAKTWQEVTRVYAENEEKAKDYANEQTYDLQGCNVEWEMVDDSENWSEVGINSWRSWEVEELEWYDDDDDDEDDDDDDEGDDDEDDEGEEESEENELVDDEPAVKIIPTHFLQNIKL